MTIVREVSQELLNKLFSSNVIPRIQLDRSNTFSTKYSKEELREIQSITENKLTVVGIDIYQYSQFITKR